MSAESDHLPGVAHGVATEAPGESLAVLTPGVLMSQLVRVVSARSSLLACAIAAEWLAIGLAGHAAAGWPWPLALSGAALVVVATWLPLHLLVVRPAGARVDELRRSIAACQAGAAERDMIMAVLEDSSTRLRAIFNNSPNGVVMVDPDTTCPIDFNDTMPRLLGYSRSEFALLPMSRYVADESGSTIRAHVDRASRGATEQFSTVCRTRTGSTFDASFAAQVVTVDGRPAVSCIVRDISQEREAERALRLNHDKLQSMISELERRNQERTILTEMGGVLQACVSLEEALTAISRFGKRLFPLTSGALYVYSHSRSDLELAAWWEPPVGAFDDVIVPNDCWGLRQGHAYDRSDPSTNLPCRHVGEDASVSYLCLPLTAQGETLGVLHLRAADAAMTSDGAPGTLLVNRPLLATVCDQITLGIANLKLRDTLRHQSIHDPLTGLYNRRYMEETLRREVPRAIRNGRPLAVIMADLDRFKTFNDTFGHEAGDTVLAELGLLLKSHVRASDIACRYGGEEFALVLPETTLEGTLMRVETIRAHVAELRVQQRDRNLGGLTLSLGVALLPQHGSTSEDLLRAADKALYGAKQAGRNQAKIAEVEQS